MNKVDEIVINAIYRDGFHLIETDAERLAAYTRASRDLADYARSLEERIEEMQNCERKTKGQEAYDRRAGGESCAKRAPMMAWILGGVPPSDQGVCTGRDCEDAICPSAAWSTRPA